MPTLIKPSRLFSNELLQRCRQQGDPAADAVIATVVEENGRDALRQLMTWLADNHNFATDGQPEAVRTFFATYNRLPAWADAKQMAEGMRFFKKNAGQIGLILGCFSLPYCYLGADGAQVLWLTERIKNDTVRRLQETGEWVFGINDPKEWVSEKAVNRTLKIRLIHAGARWFSMHSGRWNINWGTPVNQEDMAGTNLAFSYIVLLGLRKMGVLSTEQEEESYLHHINVVGYLNGVSEELLPQNLREAYLLGRSIAQRHFKPSEAGEGLTRSLLNAIVQQVSDTASQSAEKRPETIRNLAAGQMRFFLGDQHADWLAIPKAALEKRLVGITSRLPVFSGQLPGL